MPVGWAFGAVGVMRGRQGDVIVADLSPHSCRKEGW
jgi:hypothetical protein